MPFQVTIDPTRQWVTLVGSGDTDAAGFRAALLALVANPAFHAGYRLLLDVRALDYTPSVEETKQFAHFHSTTPGLNACKVAVVVGKPVDYGMANMFATWCSIRQKGDMVRGFQSVVEAEKWLMES